jgi:hypothetical protein
MDGIADLTHRPEGGVHTLIALRCQSSVNQVSKI